MLVKMERFITEAVFSCTSGTSMSDNISQETAVIHYSLKQSDRSRNQSTEGQSPVQQMMLSQSQNCPCLLKSVTTSTATAMIITLCNLVTGNDNL